MRVARTRSHRRVVSWLAGAVLALIVLGGLYTVLVGRQTDAAVIPPPIGGPDIAQDVNTMIGKKGPGFTLRDGDGRAYTIVPGGTNKPLVLISHMGFY